MNVTSAPLCVVLSSLVLAVSLTQSSAAAQKPRVASLNLCADQLIMLLADPEQIVSLSRLATEKAGSFYAEQAASYPQNNATAEEIITVKPDVVIAGAFTVNYTPRLLEELGVSVETLPLANSIEDAINNITLVAKLLDQTARGAQVTQSMRYRLAALPAISVEPEQRPRAAVYDANGTAMARCCY